MTGERKVDQGVTDSAPERALGATLEQLVPGAQAVGIVGSGRVTVVQTQWHGSNFVTVTYRDEHGRTDEAVLGRDQEAALRISAASTAPAFDGDPEAWRLAAEALRIQYAALFDPMLAIATSDLQALPHQITAVYGELLPRTPLRYLLADDPGAGKTIMAGLYIKELILRGDLARCLIVAPGSLVEQWQDELLDKFGLRFELLTRSMVDAEPDGNVFNAHPLLIARMDMLSRDLDLQADLERTDWDLIVVDEAHRMSAHYFGAELKTTKRYQLGQLLGRVCRHLLLMTATPHAGKQEDFQLFLALLDGDRFEGRYRDGVHTIDPGDLMRRMVKEELLTMEGTPLFPERRAYTVPYELSDDEKALYEAVSEYVREEMNRADRLKAEGEGRRGNQVGFALTVLQRRLASSPEAIWQSLVRRRDRLEKRRQEMLRIANADPEDQPLRQRLDFLLGRRDLDDEAIDDLEDLAGDELEELEEDVVDAATAAKTVAELETEIAILNDLAELARRVRFSGTDRKWTELRTILNDRALTDDENGNPRKIIVFTEHRDTLNYLVDQIRTMVGRDEAVVAIHGGVKREDRRKVQAVFTQDKETRVLVATDAAGEGLNLQRAHLMVNYDLPWNPNRIEQRFGRIHRIGQREVCHLWNLVAANTREGNVFQRLLEKIEEQRIAYQGKVFDVLGDAFAEQPLRKLLMDAIRYGDQPEVRARLDEVIDETVGEGLDRLIAERALHAEILAEADIDEIRRRLEDAQARRLQPHYIQAFFIAAFQRLGGRITPREAGRYEITHVPAAVRDRDRLIGFGAPVLHAYERVTFQREHVNVAGEPKADLVAPGHPLLDAVVSLTVEANRHVLKHGAVLVDAEDAGETPRLLVAVTQSIADGHDPSRTVSKRFDFVEIAPDGTAVGVGPAPYLDYVPASQAVRDLLAAQTARPWEVADPDGVATTWAIVHSLPQHLAEVTGQIVPATERARQQVRQRLLAEINFWDARHAELLDLEAAGKKQRIKPETAQKRARDLENRLDTRMGDLELDAMLRAHPPMIAGMALVIPQGLLDRLEGKRTEPVATYAKETAEVDRRAVAAVMAAERGLGRVPTEMAHNNPGFDIRSEQQDGPTIRIEVKGRIEGADDFQITRNEVLTAKNLGDDYRLALVRVSQEGPEHDQVCYLVRPFDHTGTDDFSITRFTLDWEARWNQGGPPL
jgi:superfamily II DNA or RNA helicase